MSGSASISVNPPPVELVDLQKISTEIYLGNNVTNVTLTASPFLVTDQKRLIYQALNENSIHSMICPEDDNSTLGAVFAYRHAQFHATNSESVSIAECTYGLFGVEAVIMVEYIGEILTVNSF
jgi:hypothetical protein